MRHVETGFELRWDALEALEQVDETGIEAGTGNLKVAHAKLWEQKRDSAGLDGMLGDRPQLSVVKNFDWTYTSTYSGAVSSDDKVCLLKVHATSTTFLIV